MENCKTYDVYCVSRKLELWDYPNFVVEYTEYDEAGIPISQFPVRGIPDNNIQIREDLVGGVLTIREFLIMLVPVAVIVLIEIVHLAIYLIKRNNVFDDKQEKRINEIIDNKMKPIKRLLKDILKNMKIT